jgi:hypothetical protein
MTHSFSDTYIYSFTLTGIILKELFVNKFIDLSTLFKICLSSVYYYL